MGVRVPPLELSYQWKGKPTGDGTRLENGGATSLEGSTPSSSAERIIERCASGRAVRRQPSKLDRRVQLPRGTLGNRLTAGPLTLNRAVEVRVLLPELGDVQLRGSCGWS